MITILGLITGLLGTALTAWIESKKAANEIELEKQRGANAIALANAEIAKIEKMEAAKITQMVAVADAGNYSISVDNDKATYNSWVDYVRGMIRPGLTIASNLVLFILIFSALWFVGPELMKSKGNELVDTAIYLAISTGLWWFGVRVIGKK